eukprot:gnl/TRDRNA2_/TRDRNA2_89847_c0_seq2.p1 gnl/TRDRNA2_/TRDRNA2_89847_c0~~gnl/TRDRNA2_/TRDRNA2_89847_c0_seq2.p1  ORF type:complete len:106 (-),score=1.06 gnl/TRDRNA2_/TRDRNA2_89847_c0_seq2:13-330(-)
MGCYFTLMAKGLPWTVLLASATTAARQTDSNRRQARHSRALLIAEHPREETKHEGHPEANGTSIDDSETSIAVESIPEVYGAHPIVAIYKGRKILNCDCLSPCRF